jgi:DNA-binding FadR family transcriptional regulator
MMLAERLHVEILKRLGAGEWPPGSRLPTEAQLCDMFEVSRPVVREALSRLRSDRVIETRRGSGSVVCTPEPPRSQSFSPVASIADLIRFYEFRIAIESQTASLAAERRSEADLEALERTIERVQRSHTTGQLDFAADFSFHIAIADACQNQFFASAIRLIEDQARFGMNLSDYFSRQHSETRIARIVDEHHQILKAIRERDSDAAGRLMTHHLTSARLRTVGDDVLVSPSKR